MFLVLTCVCIYSLSSLQSSCLETRWNRQRTVMAVPPPGSTEDSHCQSKAAITGHRAGRGGHLVALRLSTEWLWPSSMSAHAVATCRTASCAGAMIVFTNALFSPPPPPSPAVCPVSHLWISANFGRLLSECVCCNVTLHTHVVHILLCFCYASFVFKCALYRRL